MNQSYSYNGYQITTGRVEVCDNGTYVPVCSGGLDEDDAQDICSTQGSLYYSK